MTQIIQYCLFFVRHTFHHKYLFEYKLDDLYQYSITCSKWQYENVLIV